MRSPSRHGLLDLNVGGSGGNKGPWSAEEDEKLIAYIKRYGIWNWTYMPKAAGLARSGKSCRLRWMNYLRPNIRHGNFTREEEQTIIKLQQELGNRWSVIATKIPGRTDNDIKNYWNTRLKRYKLRNDGHIKKTMVETTTSIDNGTLKASSKETGNAPTSSADSHSPSSFASSDITFQHGEEHSSSLNVDNELQSFWENLIPIQDLYSTTESIYMEPQYLALPSYQSQEFTCSSDLFGDFSFNL